MQLSKAILPKLCPGAAPRDFGWGGGKQKIYRLEIFYCPAYDNGNVRGAKMIIIFKN